MRGPAAKSLNLRIRRFSQRLESDCTHLEKVSLTPSFIVQEAACITSDSAHEKVGPRPAACSHRLVVGQNNNSFCLLYLLSFVSV
jgi:hypothetical protein